ncbi:hypothetical protein ACN99C_26765 (plasmid) [Pseudomonas alloputida]|uniref:hypothetical protein n=1 Tax=Pseudomonas alloputida TaxID=1940621 RepID=UPI003B4319ED
MPVARRITFRANALFDQSIFRAMVSDGITGYEYDEAFGTIETFDSLASDFPALREALQAGSYTYAVYQQRENEGDHIHWRYSTAGEPDELSDGGLPPPIQFVREASR